MLLIIHFCISDFERDNMKKILKFPLVWLFFLFLFGYMIFDISQYNKTFSELENRELAQRPTFTLSSFYNNKFSPKYESYINDQFVLRDQWITLKSWSESLLGKIENNGICTGKMDICFSTILQQIQSGSKPIQNSSMNSFKCTPN